MVPKRVFPTGYQGRQFPRSGHPAHDPVGVEGTVHARRPVDPVGGDGRLLVQRAKAEAPPGLPISKSSFRPARSAGASLPRPGYELGGHKPTRVIAMVGDGSFQLTAQEVSTMVRYRTRPIIMLVNNRGYTIEAEIHDGPYNRIKNWDYAGPEESLEDLSTDRAAKHRISRVWVVLIPKKIAFPGFVGMPTRSPKSQSLAIMTPATIFCPWRFIRVDLE